jgi:hypothetical protein
VQNVRCNSPVLSLIACVTERKKNRRGAVDSCDRPYKAQTPGEIFDKNVRYTSLRLLWWMTFGDCRVVRTTQRVSNLVNYQLIDGNFFLFLRFANLSLLH